MSKHDIKTTIRALHETLEQSGPVDPETRELLSELDQDVHRLLAQESVEGEDEGGLQERLEALAADFDSRYPQLSGILRELGVALARVGI
jgi:signal transduction histidine kinase